MTKLSHSKISILRWVSNLLNKVSQLYAISWFYDIVSQHQVHYEIWENKPKIKILFSFVRILTLTLVVICEYKAKTTLKFDIFRLQDTDSNKHLGYFTNEHNISILNLFIQIQDKIAFPIFFSIFKKHFSISLYWNRFFFLI